MELYQKLDTVTYWTSGCPSNKVKTQHPVRWQWPWPPPSRMTNYMNRGDDNMEESIEHLSCQSSYMKKWWLIVFIVQFLPRRAMMWKQRRTKQVRPHSNAAVIAHQQDKCKDHPYLLLLANWQRYHCHGVDSSSILGLDAYHRIQLKNLGYLTGKIHKKEKIRQNNVRHKNIETPARFKWFGRQKNLELLTKTKKELRQPPSAT